jgi:hypothetical protein
MAETQVIWENDTFVGEELSPSEAALLEEQVLNVLAADSPLLKKLFAANMPKIRAALQVAKKELSAVFTGISAGDPEIGVSLIRAGHILRTTGGTETPSWDWSFSFTAGNDYWIGYSTNNTTAINIDSRIGSIIMLGVVFTQGNSPVVEDLFFQVGPTTYPLQVIRQSWLGDADGDNRFARIRPLLVKAKDTLICQTRETLAGQNEMVMVGLTFATGFYLRLQAPTTVTT